MSSDDLAVSVRGLSKSYTIRHHATAHVALAKVALDRVRRPFQRSERERFWALRDVSLDVRQGEVFGLLGRNGAGKSTLLKVVSRITNPTAGEVRLWGRVGSLLEVGTGFHPELTGRENVYLNGSILGMRRKEIDRQFDAIVDFAGFEHFLDTPVKRFSSGMYVRLAFAVAAHLQTEILLVDEVLAVGDAEFQKRCLGKMDEVAHEGRTVLFVSHNIGAIAELAHAAAWISSGSVRAVGPTDDVIAEYMASLGGERHTEQDLTDLPRTDFLPRDVELVRARLVGSGGGIVPFGAPLVVEIDVRGARPVRALNFALTVRRLDAGLVGTAFGRDLDGIAPGDDATFRVELADHGLTTGHYQLDLTVCRGAPERGRILYDRVTHVLDFEVAPVDEQGASIGDWSLAHYGPTRFRDLDQSRVLRATAR